jgi:hypothetical protein
MDLSALSDEDFLKLRPTQNLASLSDKEFMALRPPQYTPDQPSNLGALAIGAGKGIYDLGAGLQQGYQWVKGMMGGNQDAAQADLATKQQEENRLYAPLKRDFPWMTGIGESFPQVAASALSGGSATIPAAMLKQGLAAAVPAALSYGSPEERAIRAAKAGAETAAATGVVGAIGKAITPAKPGLNAPDSEVLQAAQRVGYQLTPAQKLDSVPLKYFERGLAQRTGSAPMFEELNARNAEALNRAAASDLGQPLSPVRPAFTTDVFSAARDRISNDFKTVTAKIDSKLGDDFVGKLIDVEAKSKEGVFPSLRAADGGKLIDGVITDALDLAAAGNLKGKTYDLTRRSLSARAAQAFKSGEPGGPELGKALNGIIDALDEAAGQSLTKTEQAAFQQARKQWSVLRTLEQGNVVQAGNVNPNLIRGQMQKNYGIPYKEGKIGGGLVDIARLSEGVKGMPDSGTAGSLVGMNMTVNPTGLFQTLANTPFRYGLGKAYLSDTGQKYISNQALTPEMKRRLMQAGGLLGAGYPDNFQRREQQ